MVAVTTQTTGAELVTKKRQPKAVLYVEIPESLKLRIDALAARRKRKITAEVIIALERYVDAEEAKDARDAAREDD